MSKQHLTDAEYVATLGTNCPVCQSTQLEGSSVDIDGGFASQEIWCKTCGASWNDTYTLTGYTNLDTSECAT